MGCGIHIQIDVNRATFAVAVGFRCVQVDLRDAAEFDRQIRYAQRVERDSG